MADKGEKVSSLLQPDQMRSEDTARPPPQPTETDDVHLNTLDTMHEREAGPYIGIVEGHHKRLNLILTYAFQFSVFSATLAISHRPGESLVVLLFPGVPPDGINLMATFFSASSWFCMSAGFLAVSAKWALSNHTLHEDADYQPESPVFGKWPLDFLLQSSWNILLTGGVLLICGHSLQPWYGL